MPVLNDQQQAAVCCAVRENAMVLTGGPGTGKCLVGETLVASEAGLTPIEALHPERKADTAVSLSLTVPTTQGVARSAAFYSGGEHPTIRIRTARGFELQGTHQHPVWCASEDGPVWRQLRQLEIGDYIGSHVFAHSGGNADMHPNLAYLLGALIADGCLSDTTPSISKSNVAFLTGLGQFAREHLRANPSIIESQGRVPALRLRGGRAVDDALRVLDVPRCVAAHKRIPSSVMESSAAAWRTFLRGLFDCDGSIDTRGAIELMTASERLGGEVQVMLAACGIWSSRLPKTVAFNGESRTYWRLTITGADIDVFRSEIGLTFFHKGRRAEQNRDVCRNTNVDIVPCVERLIGEVFRSAGPHTRKEWSAWKREIAGTRRPSRRRIQDLLAECPVTPEAMLLRLMSAAGTRWDRIAAIEKIQTPRAVFDLSVPGAESFVANGLYVHNTTTCREIIRRCQDAGLDILCAAPTGKASKRLQEQTGMAASTIHRLLQWSPQAGGFTVDHDNPLDAGVVLVDETSMVDTMLMQALLDATQPGTKLILVGDVDQLPSIGAGNVLRDIIDSRAVPVVRLEQIYRQSENSWIRVNAQHINCGEKIHVDNAKSEDFFFIEHEKAEGVAEEIIQLVTRDIPTCHGLDPIRDVQVLCPQWKGTIGVHLFNSELQAALNPRAPNKAERKLGRSGVLRVGDKVIHTRNNYELGVYNGEVGIVASIDKRLVRVDFEDRVVAYDFESVHELQHCFATTIHKSQGSEYPCVVVPVHSYNAFMLSRPLLYTAVTRGQRFVYLVGDKKGLQRAIKNDDVIRRHTALAERLSARSGVA